MAFDGTHFNPSPPPAPPKRDARSERLLCILLVALAVCGLILPVSAAALHDLAVYVGRRAARIDRPAPPTAGSRRHDRPNAPRRPPMPAHGQLETHRPTGPAFAFYYPYGFRYAG